MGNISAMATVGWVSATINCRVEDSRPTQGDDPGRLEERVDESIGGIDIFPVRG